MKNFAIVIGKTLMCYFQDNMVYIAWQHFWSLLLATEALTLRVAKDDGKWCLSCCWGVLRSYAMNTCILRVLFFFFFNLLRVYMSVKWHLMPLRFMQIEVFTSGVKNRGYHLPWKKSEWVISLRDFFTRGKVSAQHHQSVRAKSDHPPPQ